MSERHFLCPVQVQCQNKETASAGNAHRTDHRSISKFKILISLPPRDTMAYSDFAQRNTMACSSAPRLASVFHKSPRAASRAPWSCRWGLTSMTVQMSGPLQSSAQVSTLIRFHFLHDPCFCLNLWLVGMGNRHSVDPAGAKTGMRHHQCLTHISGMTSQLHPWQWNSLLCHCAVLPVHGAPPHCWLKRCSLFCPWLWKGMSNTCILICFETQLNACFWLSFHHSQCCGGTMFGNSVSWDWVSLPRPHVFWLECQMVWSHFVTAEVFFHLQCICGHWNGLQPVWGNECDQLCSFQNPGSDSHHGHILFPCCLTVIETGQQACSNMDGHCPLGGRVIITKHKGLCQRHWHSDGIQGFWWDAFWGSSMMRIAVCCSWGKCVALSCSWNLRFVRRMSWHNTWMMAEDAVNGGRNDTNLNSKWDKSV